MSVTCAAACVATADARPIEITSPTAARLRARRLDELTDFLWRCEDHGGTVALHTGADRDRFAGKRPKFARVGLEPQVELPDLLGFAVRCGDRVGVAAL